MQESLCFPYQTQWVSSNESVKRFSLFDLELIAERPDKCQRFAVIWQCLVSSILVMCAQAADAD